MLPNQDTEYTILKSLGDAYLQVAQGQRDAVTADDKNRWSVSESEGIVVSPGGKMGRDDKESSEAHGDGSDRQGPPKVKNLEKGTDKDAAKYDQKGKVNPGEMQRMEKTLGKDSAAFKAWKKQKGLSEDKAEEVSEAMRPGELQRKMAAKMHDPYVRGGSKTRGQAHNIAVRGDVSTGDPAIKSRGGDPKKAKGMGYGDQGAGNAAARKAGNEPMRGNRDPRPKNESYRGMTVGEILSENSEGV